MQNPAEVKGRISNNSRRLWNNPQCKEVKYRMIPSGSLCTKKLKSQKLPHNKSSHYILRDSKRLVFKHSSEGCGTQPAKSVHTALQQKPDTLPLGEHNLNDFTKMLDNLMLSGN